MPLAVGQTLSHYEILGSLGAGAMGEVYRARDTQLGREVAIKVLPAHFAEETERLLRFEREARSLASLNHANIGQIYSVDKATDPGGELHFLALELIPGETLEDRLRRGALSLDETLDVCRQIAAGLEAAHEAGVIHRDLKPANIRITPDDQVKLLDFGLAKPSRPDAVAGSGSSSDSVLSTGQGRLLGTPTYMAPEQARGKPIDRRVDVWAFGCVLFECLTGERAFAGATLSDVLASVLEREPDWSRLPGPTPSRLRELLERCLRKDAAQRLRDAGDARVTLAELGGSVASPRWAASVDAPGSARAPRRALGVAAVFLLGVVLGLAAWRLGAAPTDAARPLQVVLATPGFDGLIESFTGPMLSRDGRWLAYPGSRQIRLRSLERLDDRGVPGSENADGLFWSPDSDALGFSKDGQLWSWSLGRAESRPIGALPSRTEFNGGLWMPDGTIYFSLFSGDLYAMPASGGEARVVLEREPGEVDFHHPALLPGGEQFVAVAHRETGKQQLFAFSCADQRRTPLLEMEELSTAVWLPGGFLLLMRNWTTEDLWAVRFSPGSQRIEGEPFPVELGLQFPSVADDGSMVCVLGAREALFDMLWVDRDGSLTMVPGGPFQGLAGPALSRDGLRIAYSAVTDDNRDIWVLDVERGTSSRLTSDPGNESAPRWSADESSIFYEADVPGRSQLWRVAVDGASPPVLLVDAALDAAVLPVGDAILFGRDNPEDLTTYRLDLEPGADASPFLRSNYALDQLAISPDGQWLAGRSKETGQSEVFLRRLPEGTSKLQVSLGGGEYPIWGPGGATLFYLHGDELMQVAMKSRTDAAGGDVSGGHETFPQRPTPLLDLAELGIGVVGNAEDRLGFGVTPDDQRFVLARRSAADPRAGILYFREFQPAER